MEEINLLPQDIINYIGKFYNPKLHNAIYRISKIKNKIIEIQERNIEQWIKYMILFPHIFKLNNHYHYKCNYAVKVSFIIVLYKLF